MMTSPFQGFNGQPLERKEIELLGNLSLFLYMRRFNRRSVAI